MIPAAKAAFELHVPSKPVFGGENEIQHSSSPRWSHCDLEEEVIISAF